MRRFILVIILLMWSFNPRICKRCDSRLRAFIIRALVSIHASVKDATFFKYCSRLRKYVSIHASVKDATIRWASSYFWSCCFNPRICKRCDMSESLIDHFFGVSIHASVKDATQPSRSYALYIDCFNPRICKRCDTSNPSTVYANFSFNPRICKRCDRKSLLLIL